MTVADLSIIKSVLRYTVPGASEVLNIFTHRYQGAVANDSDILDAIEDWCTLEWGPTWANIASAGAVLQDVHVTVEDLLGQVLQDLGIVTLAIAGGLPGEPMPAAVSAYLQLNTNTPGVYGRKYVPAVAETTIDSGIFNAGGIAQMGLLVLDYLSSIPVTGGGVLYSGVVSSKLGAYRSFTSGGTFSTIPAYQRRRKQGVGS